MITLEFKCTNTSCENGQINTNRYWKDKEPNLIPCNVCSGTGKQLVNIATLVMREVNLGDHGETRVTALDVPEDLTLKEFLMGLFNPASYRFNDLIQVSFSKADLFMAYNSVQETSPF